MSTPRPRTLDGALERLPRDLPPGRDLWAGIEAAIARPAPRRRAWPLALAAGVAVLSTAGLVSWQLAHAPAAPPAGGEPVAMRTVDPAFAVPVGTEYLATRARLESTYRDRLGLLPPETRRRVEADLALIRAANADIRRALAAEPASPVLSRLLEGVWQQEFDLYVNVARSTDPAASRNPT